MCVCVWVYAHERTCSLMPEGDILSPKARVTGSCESPNMNSGSPNWFLCKDCSCSQPLNCFSSPSLETSETAYRRHDGRPPIPGLAIMYRMREPIFPYCFPSIFLLSLLYALSHATLVLFMEREKWICLKLVTVPYLCTYWSHLFSPGFLSRYSPILWRRGKTPAYRRVCAQNSSGFGENRIN